MAAKDRMTPEGVREFWRQQAVEHGQSPAASWSDQPVIEMEIECIAGYLGDGDRVLDVGCANGFSTVQLAASRDVEITGVDYVDEMIAQANERLTAVADGLAGTVEFRVGDAMQLEFDDGSFDAVVTTRVLINLGDWERQLVGIRECLRVARPGGILLLSEASLQGWQRLNAMRVEWGLAEIRMPSFNSYLDEECLIAELGDAASLVEVVDFASSYYVGTRVLKPLLAQLVEHDVEVANPLAEWNRWCAKLPPAGDYGTQKVFVFRKL